MTQHFYSPRADELGESESGVGELSILSRFCCCMDSELLLFLFKSISPPSNEVPSRCICPSRAPPWEEFGGD